MRFAKLCIILLLLIISISAVSADDADNSTTGIAQDNQYAESEVSYTFTNLTTEINGPGDTLDMQHDYRFNNESDAGYILIDKDNFTINGNNHIIDGNKQSGIFNITGNNVIINNLVFSNGKSGIGGIIDSTGEITLNNVTFILNNVTFISDHTKYLGGAIANHGGKINCYNSRFIDNHAESGAAIFIENGELNIMNTNITSSIQNRYGQIWARFSTVNIDCLNIINVSSLYSPAISLEYCRETIITNSCFVNLTADISAGAIGLKRSGNLYIKNCEFINTKSFKNAGAVIVDYIDEVSNVTMLDSRFYNSSSLIGGAYVQLGGFLSMNNTEFINNNATFNGGALYLSFVTGEVNNCTFDSNSVERSEGFTGLGGAIYSDSNSISIEACKFINNSAIMGNAIFLYDSRYAITNNIFVNNKNAVCSVFDQVSYIYDNIYNNDSVLTNLTLEYEKYSEFPTWTFDLINNTIDVTTIPSRFDLRDWGWVSSVKHQGHMGACWTFGTLSALESAILKSYGIELDLSEANLHHNMLRYSIYGSTTSEGGGCIIGSSYLTGWYGPILEEDDHYDEVGKLLPYISLTDYDIIHIQDVMFLPANSQTNNSEIKLAIMKYGAIGGSYYAEYGDEGFYDAKRASQYTNESIPTNHVISIVGWDDHYSKDNFLITPPGDGAWIVKNSWGTQFGDKGFLYISYYDKTFLSETEINDYAMAILIENTIPYNKNYQYDFTWGGQFIEPPANIDADFTYKNVFNAADDDLLAAVGTYFNGGGENYTVCIYVNDELKLVQNGISPFLGYHTIKLNEYVSIKKGDVFAVVITSNAMPYTDQDITRVHCCENVSFIYDEGEWKDLCENEMTACIKAYTVNDDSMVIENRDISVDYAGGKYFTVKVTTADGIDILGAVVNFKINGQTIPVKTDKNGIAKIKIAQTPGKYTIKTVYNGKTYSNNIVVKHVITASKVTVKKTAKKFTLRATLKINGKLVKGKVIKFKLNGKTYEVKTNSKGIAQKTLNKNVIKKLKKGKTYTVKVSYGKDTIKTTLKVK